MNNFCFQPAGKVTKKDVEAYIPGSLYEVKPYLFNIGATKIPFSLK